MGTHQRKADSPKPLLGFLTLLVLLALGVSSPALAADPIEHPFKTPQQFTKGTVCPNCGMMLNMWARTRHQFTNSEGTVETCSIHCLADLSEKAGEPAKEVKAAAYLDPAVLVPADKAVYVVGSQAPGTMSMKSNLAFPNVPAADAFIAQYGGEKTDFAGAYKVAVAELQPMRGPLEKRRTDSGKIAPLGETATCTVCGMPPAKFPANRTQITTANDQHLHFCSTHCLAAFRANPLQYAPQAEKEKSVWVTVSKDGDLEYASGLYYVVGSGKNGPMGKEAFPFRSKADAESFAKAEGGKVVKFSGVTPETIAGK